MHGLGESMDNLMGGNAVPCDPDDPRPMLLLEAGIGLLPGIDEFNADSKLQEFADPSELKRVMNNLSALYLEGRTFADDILDNATVGDVISHLDLSKVEFALEALKKQERATVIAATRNDLDDLKNDIDSTMPS